MENNIDPKDRELLLTVSGLFMTYGIKSLTMDDIARHLGISKKTLYKSVSDKKDLVKKCMKLAIENDECALCEIENATGNAIDKVYSINKMVSLKLQSIQPSVIYDLQRYYPEAWGVMENHKKDFILNQIESNILEGIEEGLYRDNLNPKLVATIYVTLIDAIFDSKLFRDTKYSFEEMHVEIARYHLKGIASEKGIKYIKQLFDIDKKETPFNP